MKVKLDIRDWANIAPNLKYKSGSQNDMTEEDIFYLSRQLWDVGLNVAVIRGKKEVIIFAYKMKEE